MAKKFGKALLATALIGTAAAGAYYYLKKKKEEEAFDFDTDGSVDADSEKTRNYVPLNFEKAGEKVNIFVSKAGDVLEKTVDMVKQKVGATSDDVVEEFFDDEDDDIDIDPIQMDDDSMSNAYVAEETESTNI